MLKKKLQDFCFWEEQADMLLPVPLSTTKPWDVIHKTDIGRFWKVERRQAGQGPWGLSNNMVVSSLICFHFFNLMYPRPGANEASNPEMPKGTDKKGPLENLLSLAKDEDKSSLTRQKTFRQWLLCSCQTLGKTGPSSRGRARPRLSPLPGYDEGPLLLPARGGQELRLSFLPPARQYWGLKFYLHLGSLPLPAGWIRGGPTEG